jgi:hypothetical protein
MADDFSALVKKALADRVGHLCSNPDCRALTSGPQDDPAKAVNLGVAAHITAASPGGPRYDPDLLPEERSSPSNGLWLCQNCAKLVDNDVVRFPVGTLNKWKREAEEDSKKRLGKTATSSSSGGHFDLKVYDQVRLYPIVPRVHELSDFCVAAQTESLFVFKKQDSLRSVDVPKSLISSLHRLGDGKPTIVRIAGRVQWVTQKRNFDLFLESPPEGSSGAYGIAKDVDLDYPRREGIQRAAWAREERLHQLLTQGWYVYYGLDGTYLRNPGRDANQILITDWI